MALEIKKVTQFIKKQVKPGLRKKKKVTVQGVARHFKVSRRWLVEFFQREKGMTPIQFIHQIQFQYVERLCTRKNHSSMLVMATKVGIPRATYYRLVKKMTGEAPGRRYRRFKKK